MKNREFLFFAGTFAASVCLVGFIVVRTQQWNSAITVQKSKVFTNVTAAEIVGKPVGEMPVLVEFADYECPPCASLHRKLRDWLPGKTHKLKFAYRNFPLEFHPFALQAAVAAEAAREQGRFEEFQELLFQNGSRLTKENLDRYAVACHLDMVRFHRSVETSAKIRVANDRALVDRLRLSGTPTLIFCSTNGTARTVSFSELESGL